MRSWLAERTTGDLLVLLIAGTVCWSVIAAGAAVAVVEITKPNTDTAAAVSTINDILNTLIGLMAGFLAGRTESEQRRRHDREPVDGDHV